METITMNKLVKLDYFANEAFKKLRTNIQFSGADVKVIGITSCIANEGKSSLAFNLALSMAVAGKRTVYVDADLRKSVTIGRFRINKAVSGLTHYLSGITKEEPVYQTNINNLYMVFSGPVPPDPSELLATTRFKELLQNLRRDYDYVIVDNSPLGLVIDAAVVANVCDGMILVVSSGEISYKFAQSVKAQLEKTGCRILGAVINKADMSKNGNYGRYYGKYYGHNEHASGGKH
ncbi:polysaccharide biosynthesis tyrosine autokinase [Parasporobacterium paucivorans]|uniref:non-specific protein-tyrosine kinase n=1 Tax=Parasporobacterium paucivorans DSM 15970 TaxID=1122934 RepID=A0A1M6E8H4_9FIRM|nr:polysaccharide biosynthesis tyrosine autokinase [Parasporobacterium paucivorans]SHI81796.1 capsular exopolysaccharide family [Parasporobacterium paucivorans DSM 15970]